MPKPALLGIAAAGLFLAALDAYLYGGEARTLALGAVAGLQEAGSVFGRLYGVSLAALASWAGGWRFVFWFNVPLAAACAVGLLLAMRREIPSMSREGSSIDWISALLLGIGLGLLVVALYPDDPDHRATGSLLVPAGIASLLVLSLYGWRQGHRLEPLRPRGMLRSPALRGHALAH